MPSFSAQDTLNCDLGVILGYAWIFGLIFDKATRNTPPINEHGKLENHLYCFNRRYRDTYSFMVVFPLSPRCRPVTSTHHPGLLGKLPGMALAMFSWIKVTLFVCAVGKLIDLFVCF